ncbi:MAG TPA: TIGR04053 family radical SAM/SPASM domain-containing protein [Spirochaetia bacterium]|nr:TIGR04053 family radical SAM/SPASM domain-containing protein [Spirochaetia bacterium]
MQPPWMRPVDFSKKPIFVCWETTKSCLLSCRHCRATAIRSTLPGELGTAEGLALIDQFLEFDAPYPALLFTGGDPLMRADIFDLIRHATSRGIYTAVAASVTPLLGNDRLERMRELGVEVASVSLDGASAAVHDRIREIDGTWQATLDAIQRASERGLRMQVNTTVMKSNLHQLADIFHLVRERGAAAWEVFFLVRTGRGSALENPDAAECEQVAHFLYECTQYGIPVRTSEGPHFRRVAMQRQKGAASPGGALYTELAGRLRELEGAPRNPPAVRMSGTGDGKGILFISHDGEVYPSGFLPLSCGNVKTGTLKSIYTTHPLLVDLRTPTRLKGRCGRCEFAGVCGGSRSRAFAEFEDPLQEDPSCAYEPTGVPARA